ncbi:hypothetical protein [Chitinimonas lacunae]|uniref:Uncharacterized protein n=1 Tax=Chitinimonas lacunae TaxID=1963018 RepID=A0ABV8MVT3_9NEIS
MPVQAAGPAVSWPPQPEEIKALYSRFSHSGWREIQTTIGPDGQVVCIHHARGEESRYRLKLSAQRWLQLRQLLVQHRPQPNVAAGELQDPHRATLDLTLRLKSGEVLRQSLQIAAHGDRAATVLHQAIDAVYRAAEENRLMRQQWQKSRQPDPLLAAMWW